MKVHNYLNEVKILRTPTKIVKDKFIERHCSEVKENLTLKNISEKGDKIILGNLSDYNHIGYTFRYKINEVKFNNYYKLWFKTILKQAGLPHNDILAHASVKKLEPMSHQVHTDSDNSYGNSHDVICRFLIPLTEGAPTCYFDKCMEDNYFYTRFDKNTFSVTKDDNKNQDVTITHLYDLKTQEKVEITDDVYPDYDHIKHIKGHSLLGLNVHKIGEWIPGYIHLFPFNLLHSSTDFTDQGDKWMINGVLYVPKSQRNHH